MQKKQFMNKNNRISKRNKKLIQVLFLLAILVALLPFVGVRIGQYSIIGNGITVDKVAQISPQQAQTEQQAEDEIILGEVIVKFKKESGIINPIAAINALQSIAARNAVLSKYPIQKVENVFQYPCIKNCEIKKQLGMDRFFLVKVPQAITASDVFGVIQEYKKDYRIENAEPQYKMHLDFIPNDPVFPQQWHLNQIENHDIDAPEAWDISQGEGAVIAIIDNGIEYNHNDLVDNMWQNLGEDADGDGHVLEYIGDDWAYDPGDINYRDDDGNGYTDDFVGFNDILPDYDDPIGFHGTATSGTAAATTNNELLVSGVCPRCKIMGLKGNYIAHIEYAVDNGADVVSMSFGSNGFCPDNPIFEYAYTQNVVLVASAGNMGWDVYRYPACHPKVIGVTASGTNGEHIAWTNYGSWVDVAAPGELIWTLHLNDGMTGTAGTSFSVPIVAGIVGLVKSMHPEFTNDEIMTIVQSAVDPLTSEHYVGTGKINAYKAVQYDTVPVALLYGLDNKIISGDSFDIVGTASGDYFENYRLEYGSGVYPSSWTTIAESISPVNNGILGTWNLENVENGFYTIKLTVRDLYGETGIDMAYVYHINNIILYLNDFVIGAPISADVDADNTNEMIVGTLSGNVYIFNARGEIVNGWPQFVTGSIYSSPTVGNIDDDNRLEIIVSVTNRSDNNVYVWNDDGTLVAGWPKSTNAIRLSKCSPVVDDIDDDGDMEIIVCSSTAANGKVYIWNSDGSLIAGWPQTTTDPIDATPAVADIDGDGRKEIMVGIVSSGKFYVWNDDGSNVPGWPKTVYDNIYSSAAVGDIDRDGELEIIVSTFLGTLHAWNIDGTEVAGWPKTGLGRIKSSPALGDIDNDRRHEIVIGSNNGNVYAFNDDGTLVNNWPQLTNGNVKSSPILADVDEDGRLEVIAASEYDKIYIWNDDGTNMLGWPNEIILDGDYTTPSIVDINNDGDVELLLGINTYLYIWFLDGEDTGRNEWPMFHHDIQHTGLYSNDCGLNPNHQCTDNKPLYCLNGLLMNNCQLCGCAIGTCQPDGSCRQKIINPPPYEQYGEQRI